MGVLRHRRHRLSAVFTLLFFVTALGSGLVGAVQEAEEMRPTPSKREQHWKQVTAVTRRRLGGPGSSPPTCRSRCGRCFPCRPVHVAIQPGRSVPMEYYPEAWRCKCGSKLFMP